MKIDWKFWLFLFVFILTQACICLSLRMRIDAEFHAMINGLSDQIACMAGDDDFCSEKVTTD